MSSEQSTIQKLEVFDHLRGPLLQDIINYLSLPAGSHGLDLGCGIGSNSHLLMEAVGSDGSVTGIDLSEEALAYARQKLKSCTLKDRISLVKKDIRYLNYAEHSLDWIWSCDCLGYPSGDLSPFLNTAQKVLKPEGFIAIVCWNTQQLLPGHSLLEYRLNATCSSYLPHLKNVPEQLSYQRILNAFQKAGFREAKSTSFVGNINAPLNPKVRKALIMLFDMLWGERQADCHQEDWEAYQNLCNPDSAEFILDLPDYNGFFVYTLYSARV